MAFLLILGSAFFIEKRVSLFYLAHISFHLKIGTAASLDLCRIERLWAGKELFGTINRACLSRKKSDSP